MDLSYNLKAGPPEAPRWRREPSKSKQLFIALAIAIILTLSCLASVQLSYDQQGKNWFWEVGDDRGNGWHYERPERTQYLLGVGKADITGYDNDSSS